MLLAALALVLPAPLLPRVQSPSLPAATIERATIELSPGPWRDVIAGLGADVVPAKLDARAAMRAPGLAKTETWRAWHAALVAARASSSPATTGEARARLALVAIEQGRWTDAWEHVARASASPAAVAAVLPRLVPGVEAGAVLANGGRPAPLADGCVLRPALPPRAKEATAGGPRAWEIHGLAIGAARVALRVSVEPEGVQAEVRHLDGGKAKLAIVLPRPEDFGVGMEYVDWEKQSTVGEPLVLEVAPGDEPHVLFARFEPRDPAWPTRLPDELPASIRAHGIVLVIGADDPERAAIEATARELTLPEIELSVRVAQRASSTSGASGSAGSEAGVVVDLTSPSTRAVKLAWIASALERFVLRDAAGR